MTTPSNRIIRLSRSGLLGLILLTAVFGVSQLAGAQEFSNDPETEALTYTIFNLDMDIPDGSRIDYLRLYFYDSSSSNSTAWVTSYDDAGGYTDITSVSSTGGAGYGTALSPYIGGVLDLVNKSYVLNWRPIDGSKYMQLCGLRVAYRLPLPGGGFEPTFSYMHAAGSTLRPRTSDVEWSRDGSGGCLFVPDPNLIFKDGFESGNQLAWN